MKAKDLYGMVVLDTKPIGTIEYSAPPRRLFKKFMVKVLDAVLFVIFVLSLSYVLNGGW